MSVLETLGRMARLGFFVGLGAASALLQACCGPGARLGTSADLSRHKASPDAARAHADPDAARAHADPDAARADAGPDAARAHARPRDRRWDIPLE